MRDEFPGLLQENCASGGRRLDMEMISRAHSYCRSDYFIGLKEGDTAFILGQNATHNTIASLIAIRLGCHGYNATYSHRGRSFESALQDAATQIALGDLDNALVGWFDEMTPNLSASLLSQGIEPKEHALAVVLSANPEGALDILSF